MIEAKVPQADKTLIAKVLNVSRSGIYKRGGKRLAHDEWLMSQIVQVLAVNPGYGHRRIALALRIGKRQVRRVMKLYGIKPYKRKSRWTKKRDLGRADSGYPNLIKGSCPIKPGVVLVGDFTHINHQSRSVYVATFMDLYTREVVGWQVSVKHTKELVIDALIDSIKTLGKIPHIVHTDQGTEYNSKEYLKLLTTIGINISMSRKRSPWENGYQESYYNNFKTDLGLEFDRFETLGELVEAIHHTIDYYNHHRIHLSLKMPPAEFKQTYIERVSTKPGT